MNSGHPLIQAFKHVSFSMGSAAKRYARDVTAWPIDRELTPKSEAFAWRLAYIYRRQLPKDLAEEALRRKVDHKWIPDGDRFQCATCKRPLFSGRERNAPCPGPPEEKPIKQKRDKAESQEVARVEIKFGDPQAIALVRRHR